MKSLWCFILAGLILFSACSFVSNPQAAMTPESNAIQPEIVVVDALGRKVTFAKPPSRIIMNGVGLIMIQDAVYMFAEAPDRIAAMGMANQGYGNFVSLIDPGYEKKAIFQIEASAEQMAAVRPDLVILKSYLAGKVGKSIETLNIPVLYLDFETPENYTRDLSILGKVFKNESRAKELADFFTNRIKIIQESLKNEKAKPRALLLYYNDKDGAVAFNVPPLTWIQTQMVALAGGEPVWESANTGQGWKVVTLEQIAAWDADQIFIVSYSKNSADISAGLKSNPQWQALRAVKQGHLYGFPADLYSWDQSDSRWILGLSWLAARLHPEKFPQFDILEEARQFYKELYRMDNRLFEAKIHPAFRGDLF